MSFAEYETSLQNGRPVRLYQFQRGPMKWGYTNADRNITHQSIVFKAIEGGFQDDGIRQTEDAHSDLLTLTVPKSIDVAQMYRVTAPHQTINVTIFDLHYLNEGFIAVWVGVIAGVRFTDEISASIQCQTLAASLERTGLRKTWSRTCSHQLYDSACLAPRNNFKSSAVINRIDATTIGCAAALAKPNGYYSGGYVEWVGQYGLEQRGIEIHADDNLSIFGGTYGLSLNQDVTLYAGCDRRFETCTTKFQNSTNYGGSPHMPGKSPFNGNPVF